MAETEPPADYELLSALVDDELEPGERERLEALLSQQPELQREHDALRATRQRVQQLNHAPLPDGLADRLSAALDAVDAETASSAASPQARASRAPGRRRLVQTLAVAAVAVVAVALVPLARHTTDTPAAASTTRVASSEFNFTPTNLVKYHNFWHDKYRQGVLKPPKPADQMATELAQQVGYPVKPPDEDALGAKLVACTACSHALTGGGAPAALFLMERGQQDEMTMFEVTAPAGQVRHDGFEPTADAHIYVASQDGVSLAFHSDDQSHVCLASTRETPAALAEMVPRAVRVANRSRPSQSLQLVGLDR